MAKKTRKTTHPSQARQTVTGVLTMAILSTLLLLGAWWVTPVPLVKDPVQTELLYVTVYLSPNECVTWHPQSMVDKQTARAIVNHMGDCRERPTLRLTTDALEARPRMEVHFRTEDTYRMVYLGSWARPEEKTGWAGDQDYHGLADQVLDGDQLMEYIFDHIEKDLPAVP